MRAVHTGPAARAGRRSWRCSPCWPATVGLGTPGLVGRRRRTGVGRGVRPRPRPAARRGAAGSGPADRVTLTRAALVGGVAALTVDAVAGRSPVGSLVALAAVALVLDAVDGRVARRTGTASPLGRALRHGGRRVPHPGAQRRTSLRPLGWWVLADRRWRATLFVGGRAGGSRGCVSPVPPRYWRKVVAAVQGIVLTVVAAGVAAATGRRRSPSSSRWSCSPSPSAATSWWLWRHRGAAPRSVVAGARALARPCDPLGPSARGGRSPVSPPAVVLGRPGIAGPT